MKKRHVILIESDKNNLNNLLSKGDIKVKTYKRATALIYLDEGKSYQEVSRLLGITYSTLSKWSKLYKISGLDLLYDKPRSGRPISITAEERAKITAVACSKAPEGYANWSLRLLADKIVELEIVDSISFKHVGNILKKTSYNHIVNDNGVLEK